MSTVTRSDGTYEKVFVGSPDGRQEIHVRFVHEGYRPICSTFQAPFQKAACGGRKYAACFVADAVLEPVEQ